MAHRSKSKKIEFDQVIRALKDDSNTFPPRYLYELADLKEKEYAKLKDAWPNIPLARRQRLMEDIEEFDVDPANSYEAVAGLALTDPDGFVRKQGLRVLWNYEKHELIPAYLEILKNDADPEVRAAAATACSGFIYLGEIEDIDQKTFIEIHTALLNAYHQDDNKLVRRRAVEALGFSSAPEVADIIQQAYADGDEEWLITALFAMGRSYSQVYEAQVLSMLNDSRTLVRAQAASAAGDLELKKASEPLIDMLEDPETEPRAAAIWSLSQIGGDDVREVLEQMLDETEDNDEAELLEEALENLDFTEEVNNFELMDLEDLDDIDPEVFDEDEYLSGFNQKGRQN